jgi:uncharacterized protein YyaL (SSP411 family)
MTGPDGAFYSTQDADSEGVEGKFFVWTQKEIESLLGPDDAKLFCSVYDVTPHGNWEGHSILHLSRPLDVEAKMLPLPLDELRGRLRRSKEKVLEVRGKRVWPGRDEKILTAWNGLMIASFAKAAQVLEKPEYANAAERAADFLLTKMRRDDGRLWRTTFAGTKPKLNGYLEDYAYLIDALVTLYETTFEPRWITQASALAKVMIEQFWDEDAQDRRDLLHVGKNLRRFHDTRPPCALSRESRVTFAADFYQYRRRACQAPPPRTSRPGTGPARPDCVRRFAPPLPPA